MFHITIRLKIWLCVSCNTRVYHKTARVYSFYSRDTAFIPFSFEVTYFSVDIAVILILLTNIFPFFFFIIFFYLNHTALKCLPTTCHFLPLPKQQKISVLQLCASRAINLDCFIQKRLFKGFIKNQHKEWWKNLTSCADPSRLSMKEQDTRKIGSC